MATRLHFRTTLTERRRRICGKGERDDGFYGSRYHGGFSIGRFAPWHVNKSSQSPARSSRSGLCFRNRGELRIGTPFRAIKASSNLFSTAQIFARRSSDTSDSIGQDRATAHFAISSISRSAGSYVSNVS